MPSNTKNLKCKVGKHDILFPLNVGVTSEGFYLDKEDLPKLQKLLRTLK